ncbi:membrane protein MmpS1, partial [Mycobacterium tuberculosis KT-0034]|uniref:MmpS family transport accessory protein n=1 Tax=Mycobacterium tuberculosis TaxID=1773 RepID=UPI0004598A5F
MFGVAKRFWIPMVIVIVVAVAAVTVSRLHSVFGSHQHAPDTGNLDPIIAFYPKHVLYEVFGPPGTVASINYLDADEPPRHVRRLQFLERMGSCQVVHRGGTRRSCV